MTTLTLLIAGWLGTFTGQTPTVCDPGEHYMLVAEAHAPASDEAPAACTRVPVVTLCGAPHTLAWLIESEARTIPCGELAEGQVRSVPIATAYPDSIVGYVGRERQLAGELGGQPMYFPAEPPRWGVCQGAGCYCAGEPSQCEAIPLGGPDGYWLTRLCRLRPEDSRC